MRRLPLQIAGSLLLIAGPTAAQEDDTLWLGEAEEAASPVEPLPVIAGLHRQSSTVLTGEELLRRGYRTLGDALVDIVGIVRQRTTSVRHYSMRGIPDGMTLVVDGVPFVVDGEHDLLDVDEGISLADVERVEVIRGPSSAVNGAGSLSGVVRVTTRRPGLTGGGLRLGLTHLGERDLSADASGRRGVFALRAALSHRSGPAGVWRLEKVPTRYIRFGRLTIPGTKADKDIIADDDSATLARLSAAVGDLQLDAFYTHTDIHVPISSYSSSLLDEGPQQRQLRERQRLRLVWSRLLGPVQIEANAYGGRHLRTDAVMLYPPRGTPRGGSIIVDGETATIGGLLRLEASLWRDHRLILGAFGDLSRLWSHADVVDPEMEYRDPNDPGSGQSVHPGLVLYDDLTGTATAALEYQGDFGHGWHLTAGAAIEWRTEYTTELFNIAIVPRAALVYVPQPWLSLRLAYAEGNRGADRFEIGALTQAIVAGRASGPGENKDLRPVHVRTGELAVRIEPSARAHLETDLFVTHHEGAIVMEPRRARLTPTNMDPSLLIGGELRGDVEALPDLLTLRLGGSLARTIVGPVLEYRLLTLLVAAEVTPLEMIAFGARARVGLREGDDVASGASAVTDIYGSYAILPEMLNITATLRNVLDGRELSLDSAAFSGSPDVAIPGEGRVFYVSVEGRL